MIQKNKTWELIERPAGKRVIDVKWIFKTKLNHDGSVSKLKARLVVKRLCTTTWFGLHRNICTSG